MNRRDARRALSAAGKDADPLAANEDVNAADARRQTYETGYGS